MIWEKWNLKLEFHFHLEIYHSYFHLLFISCRTRMDLYVIEMLCKQKYFLTFALITKKGERELQLHTHNSNLFILNFSIQIEIL